MLIKEVTKEDILEIISWRYEEPYSCYNYPSYEVMKRQNWAIVNDEVNKYQFKSIYHNNKLIAYFRVQREENSALIGLGLKPEYCGIGLGKVVVGGIVNYIKESKSDYRGIKLDVRKFNERAVKCYKKLGFNIVNEYSKEIFNHNIEFYEMYLQF